MPPQASCHDSAKHPHLQCMVAAQPRACSTLADPCWWLPAVCAPPIAAPLPSGQCTASCTPATPPPWPAGWSLQAVAGRLEPALQSRAWHGADRGQPHALSIAWAQPMKASRDPSVAGRSACVRMHVSSQLRGTATACCSWDIDACFGLPAPCPPHWGLRDGCCPPLAPHAPCHQRMAAALHVQAAAPMHHTPTHTPARACRHRSVLE